MSVAEEKNQERYIRRYVSNPKQKPSIRLRVSHEEMMEGKYKNSFCLSGDAYEVMIYFKNPRTGEVDLEQTYKLIGSNAVKYGSTPVYNATVDSSRQKKSRTPASRGFEYYQSDEYQKSINEYIESIGGVVGLDDLRKEEKRRKRSELRSAKKKGTNIRKHLGCILKLIIVICIIQLLLFFVSVFL